MNSSVQIPLQLNHSFLEILQTFSEAATEDVPYKKCDIHKKVTVVDLKDRRPSSLQVYQRETPMQVFSCQTCEIFMNIFFSKHLWWLLLSPKQIKRNKKKEFLLKHNTANKQKQL